MQAITFIPRLVIGLLSIPVCLVAWLWRIGEGRA